MFQVLRFLIHDTIRYGAMSDKPLARLFWDLETSPNIGLFWKSGWKINISEEKILQEKEEAFFVRR